VLSLKYVFAWLGFALIIATLGVLGILNDFAQALAPVDMIDYVIANAKAVSTGSLRSFAFVLLTAIIVVIYKKGRMPLVAAGWALAMLAAVDSWTILHQYWVFSPPASITYKSDAAIEKIKADPILSRVVTLELEDNPNRDINLEGDGLMIHRIRSVLGYHGNQLGRYNELLEKDEGFRQIFNPRVWQLLNVRYLLTNSADVERYFPGAQWVIGPVRDAAKTDVYLYKLPGENPYGWVTTTWVKAHDETALRTLFERSFNLRTAALFAPDAPVSGPDTLLGIPEPLRISAAVTHYAPGRVSLELSEPAPAGSALVVSENYFPGWSATVDGKPANLGRADFNLMGVQLPAGGRKIDLSFDDVAYERGKLITLLALALTVVLMAGGIIRERKAIG
jgi:hypothetical protein